MSNFMGGYGYRPTQPPTFKTFAEAEKCWVSLKNKNTAFAQNVSAQMDLLWAKENPPMPIQWSMLDMY